MRAVFASDVAEVAADAEIVIDAGDAFEIEVEIFPTAERVDGLADEFVHGLHAFAVEVGGEAFVHLFNDAEAAVHDGGANLDAGGAKGDVLGGVAPIADAADAGNREADFGIFGAALDHVQGDGFHRRAAIAAVGRVTVDIGLGHEAVEVHIRNAVDRVDEGNGVGSGAFRGAGGVDDIGDVRRELHDHRSGGDLHDPAGDFLGDIGILANGRAHAAFAHAVGAAEIELESVGASVLAALDEVVPFLAGIGHERGDDGVAGPAFFDLGDFAEVRFDRAVADEFDVVEADDAHRAEVHRGVAGGDIDDGVADGFPDEAAPPCFERAMGLVGGAGGRAGGEPVGIR